MFLCKGGPILERLDAKNSGSGQQQQSSGAQSQVKAGGDASGAGGQKKSEAKPAAADDDIDLFGSDEEEVLYVGPSLSSTLICRKFTVHFARSRPCLLVVERDHGVSASDVS